MTIDLLSGGTYAQPVRPKAETGEVLRAGRDMQNDGDSNDGGAVAVRSAVNLSGQTAGSTISISA